MSESHLTGAHAPSLQQAKDQVAAIVAQAASIIADLAEPASKPIGVDACDGLALLLDVGIERAAAIERRLKVVDAPMLLRAARAVLTMGGDRQGLPLDAAYGVAALLRAAGEKIEGAEALDTLKAA